MAQTIESTVQANTSEILRKNKGPILESLGDDITIASETENVNKKRNGLVTGAKKIPFMDNRGDFSINFPDRQFTPNVYVENRSGFRSHPLKDYEKNMPMKRNEESTIKRRLNDKQELMYTHNNPGLHFVISIHETLQILTFALFGLLAGASLVHTLFVQSLINPRQIKNDGSWNYNYGDGYLPLLKYYGVYARPISITFYISLVLIGVFVFGKFDLGRPTTNCIRKCVKLQNGLMAIIFYMIAFVIHNSMGWFDYIFHVNSYKSEDEIRYLLSTQIDLNNFLKIWQILDACRTAFILITWISVALGDSIHDRLTTTLNINPMKIGDGSGNNIQPN
ncbi:unnamed protein product [Schistosoma mattheei]|uniref:Uncharacterized protein n=1 Tax=Schistosoma mattheei TaxID=31246 RepID=A0AA85BBN1_9TREM|nr:unnamed protein product [Schistosoma mattheei]